MAKLTDQQLANGYRRFLAANPRAKARVDALDGGDADRLGLTLQELREMEIKREIRQFAEENRLDSHELLWSLSVDTFQELETMLAERDEATKRHLGL
jgi:hypothetical protein